MKMKEQREETASSEKSAKAKPLRLKEGAGSTRATERKKTKAVSRGKSAGKLAKSRGVVYLSHVPHGFFEKEMFSFFGQFGTVTNLKVGRSPKTGISRGYAFVEFKYPEVAKIVAQTMNNYLMFEKLLKCKVVPREEIKLGIFKNKVDPKKPPGMVSRILAKKAVNAARDEQQELKRRRKQLAKLKKQAAKLKALGVHLEVDLPSIAAEQKARAQGKTPVMQVDESDCDVTLKTPPNVRKVKSRSNSAATPAGKSPADKKQRLNRRKLLSLPSGPEQKVQVGKKTRKGSKAANSTPTSVSSEKREAVVGRRKSLSTPKIQKRLKSTPSSLPSMKKVKRALT